MANITITALPTAGAITGAELVPVVQNGVTVQTTAAAIAASPSQFQPFITIGQQPTLPNSRALGAGTGLIFTDGGPQSALTLSVTGALLSFINSGTGIQVKTGATTVTNVQIAVGTGLTISSPDGLSGNPTLGLAPILQNLVTTSGSGLITVSGSVLSSTSVSGTTNQITVTNGATAPVVGIATNPVIPGSASATLPAGNTAARPASGVMGMIRYNLDLSQFEGYTNIGWAQFAVATGGVTTFSGGTTGLTPNTATTGAVTLSGTLVVANGGTGTTTSTGTGSVVLNTSPTLVTPALGTPSSVVLTNATGTAAALNIGGTAGTVTAAAQPNITSVGTLTSLAVTGNIGSNSTVYAAGANGVRAVSGSGSTWLATVVESGLPIPSTASYGAIGYTQITTTQANAISAAIIPLIQWDVSGNLFIDTTVMGGVTFGSTITVPGGMAGSASQLQGYTWQIPYTIGSGTPNTGAFTILSATTTVTSPRLISTVATGTAPLTVTSTTPVTNLSIGGNAATASALSTSQVDILFTPQASAPTATRGAVWYDSTLDALAYNNSLGEVALGQQVLLQYCYNNTGSAIPAGSAVYVVGQFGTSPSVALATAAALATSNVIGLAVVAIPNGTYGYVINQGVLINLNTSGFTAGQTLYLSASTPGGLVNTIPATQFYNYRVAICTVSSASVGQVFVNIATAYVLPSAIVSPITFTAQSTTYIPLQIYGYSSGQIADLLDVWTYSGGTKALSISNTGVVAIPSATTTTQAATDNTTKIASTAFANTAVSTAVATLPGCNVLINGDMSISQINGNTAVTPTTGFPYILDQWYAALTQSSKITFQQVTTSLNSIGAPLSLKFTTASAFTSASSDYFQIIQPIEGNNFDRFFYGSANARSGSLQFKANASVAGTYSGAITNAATTRSYVFTFILAANTDTLITIQNIPGDTSGTWVGVTNAAAATIRFDLGSGSNFKTTAGTWQTGNYIGAIGAVALVANAGATLAISEVQFELGPICTGYERKLVSQSLAECQRYLGIVLANVTTALVSIPFPTTMRANPVITGGGTGFAQSTTATYGAIVQQTVTSSQTLILNAQL